MGIDGKYMSDSNTNGLRVLFAVEERYPPFRVDTTVLFAQEMVSRGYKITWLFETEDESIGSGWKQWQGGRAKIVLHGKRVLVAW